MGRRQQAHVRRRNPHKDVTTRQYVMRKKEVARNRGAENVPADTKYTGRNRRRPKF